MSALQPGTRVRAIDGLGLVVNGDASRFVGTVEAGAEGVVLADDLDLPLGWHAVRFDDRPEVDGQPAYAPVAARHVEVIP